MSTFVETEHPRDLAGKFAEKENSVPEVSLGSTDDLAASTASQVTDVARDEGAASAASPGRGVPLNIIKDRDERLKVMQQELTAAVEDLSSDENWQAYLNTMGRFHRYSMNNQMLIWIQRPDATKVGSHKLWKDLGRSVIKGEKGLAIFAPVLVPDKDQAGNVRYDAEGNVVKKYARSVPTTVFDISQTEGDDLPTSAWEREFTEEPPEGYVEDLEAAIAATGYELRYEDLSAAAHRGYTRNSAGEKVIVIDSSQSPGTQATTLAHELGHVMCGHMEPDRRDEYHTGHNGKRGDMEMQAESFAFVLSRANGMQTHLRGASEYVAGWEKKSQEDLRAAAETVQKAVKATLAKTKFRNLGE